MAGDTVSILDGNTFVVSDRRGDLTASPRDAHGLFLNDTRFLSRWILTIDGRQPVLLSIDDRSYFRVQFFLALAAGTIDLDAHLSVVRRRAVEQGFHEELSIANHHKTAVDLDVRIQAEADFADLFEVKEKLVKKGQHYRSVDGHTLRLGYRRSDFQRETLISSADLPEIDALGLRFQVHLEPQSTWSTRIDVTAAFRRALADPLPRPDPAERDVERWVARAPRLRASWRPLESIYRRSLVDLAALRFPMPLVGGSLPAAGLPWYMAVFGRDSLIASFQALPFASELAATTLRALAVLQGRAVDPFRDEEPGKILHELRLGELTAFEERPHSPYFGAADTTMLWLILLDEHRRWTGDPELARALEPEARAAVRWIERHGDLDGDGFIEYERRNLETGLENQCWKDSWDAIAFADGRVAQTPRATCELQGYAYDARRRAARLAREVWGDPGWAAKLEADAADLKARFNQDFWLPERGFFALALDGQKRQVDALTSNVGHLLWSGIADDDKARLCVRHLMADDLFSGWGIRTMATSEGAYNPIGYHVGTVWPHDNAIIAWGLRRSGYRAEAARVCRAMLEAAELFRGRLPEAFAGYPRDETHYPVEYPTACSPQAWSTGAPLLFLRALLGLEVDDGRLLVDPAIPEPLGRIELLDLRGAWGVTDAFGRARATGADDD
jgi:glycogen debranching enzyme